MKLLFLISAVVVLSACSPLPYVPADFPAEAGESRTDGYIDKEISKGVHVIEVRQESLLALTFSRQKTLKHLTSFWHKRANEVCPGGYQGSPETILPREARTDEFYCTLKVCQKYPLISGVAYCNKVYQL
ncbi:hypothetical protein [uncultured Thalassolituus sp.]|jgi:hypothetical protein|uniref:hypothetical protein n=1 Tax=Thalassolituus sp. TaxID=2030822 RepID=UPI0026191FCB|nr:hypothetical protein [uncultured Thalassolituus sp.]